MVYLMHNVTDETLPYRIAGRYEEVERVWRQSWPNEGNNPEFEEWEQGPQSIQVVSRSKPEIVTNGTHVKPHRLRRFVLFIVKHVQT